MASTQPTLVSCVRNADGGWTVTYERLERVTQTVTTISLKFYGKHVTLTVQDKWETRITENNIYNFYDEVIYVDMLEDEEDVFEERGMYIRFLAKVTGLHQNGWGDHVQMHPYYDVDTDLCEFIDTMVDMYIDQYEDAVASKIQAVARGWLTRRRFNLARMRVVNEISALPPTYVSPSFPGGTQYRAALAQWEANA